MDDVNVNGTIGRKRLRKGSNWVHSKLHWQSGVYIYLYIYIYICVCMYVCMYVSWPTIVECNLEGPFSAATTPRCRGGQYLFLWIVPLTLYLIMLSAKNEESFFWVFGMTQPGIEPWSPRPLANTLPTMLMDRLYIRMFRRYCMILV